MQPRNLSTGAFNDWRLWIGIQPLPSATHFKSKKLAALAKQSAGASSLLWAEQEWLGGVSHGMLKL